MREGGPDLPDRFPREDGEVTSPHTPKTPYNCAMVHVFSNLMSHPLPHTPSADPWDL